MPLWLVMLCFWIGLANAHEGHGDTPEPAPSGPQAPRFAAHSELFELVGVVEPGALRLYLDRFADNLPITEGKIELDLAGVALQAQPQTDGSFLIKSPKIPQAGSLALTFTITADRQSDLLAANLELPAGAPAVTDRNLQWLWLLALVPAALWWAWRRKGARR